MPEDLLMVIVAVVHIALIGISPTEHIIPQKGHHYLSCTGTWP